MLAFLTLILNHDFFFEPYELLLLAPDLDVIYKNKYDVSALLKSGKKE
jgi:hypothetical protein